VYLDLMEACLTGMIYRDVSLNDGKYDNERRINGGDWPITAHTMIGVKRLHHLRMCCENVIRRDVPGNFIECGVWRGGACIMMKAVLNKFGSNPMSEKDFNAMQNIKTEKEIPVFIARKSSSAKEIKPTLKEYVIIEKKPRAVKLPKTKKPQIILTDEERKANRTKWMREHRGC